MTIARWGTGVEGTVVVKHWETGMREEEWMEGNQGRTGPYTTEIESVYDICVNGTLLSTRLGLCFFQRICGV